MSRTKDQWLNQTGGCAIGENTQVKQWAIQQLKTKIANHEATDKDIEQLSKLLGNNTKFS